ncbi:MAG: 30S ribosomal protein S15 [Candidatus Jacksonbacteria bacterium RIFOXYC2_FULL_44_29]|nr:MAG: 30S ribosomal protein S15 [Parcubacteria group bacterium GW2011_GWC2_44_22]OGY74760.1 MAG: 30S ribosomal protein S15 [Candidatus Jacksonbacteria bacterium RIFOXYA2_FULL_43_12]OGY75427.1 MAG: 30S ribosomal protein S15 [Candidatus Jacksonbacteria bacterium RIFOXYB2_FULL_44_15]OGY77511.1 MAG: 30S ribosomal protein S15 [Candidatus Jacksonbacteria bacterium RIFOXYC2_FULL_44_29]OGY79888.1 MAG: 30S ribosomal protein S15 [Candidatus Jacksonbacteria bacterium RIFOXYD2_FULL_43_21]HBH46173.1 30S 
MLTKTIKDNIIEKYKTHTNDTGSASVQIALLTKEVEMLTQHLRDHKKDFSSRRGLVKKVSRRRRLLKFLRQDDRGQFEKIIKKLELRRPAESMAVEEDIKQEEAARLAEAEELIAAELLKNPKTVN